jgi:hypothetical protein
MTGKRKYSKPMTAEELMTQLRKDPEWIRRNDERQRKRQELEALLEENERPIVEELNSVGRPVTSVWELVNTTETYPEAIPVLRRHLSRPYHPKIREGIARALAVREARGATARDILNELKRSCQQDENQFRWALANALTVAGDVTLVEEIKAIIADRRYEDLRQILELALKKSSKVRL